MKLQELFEAHDELHRLSQKEFDDLHGPSPANINDRYKVGSVAFDNHKGFGHTPNNKEVDYLGWTMEMTPHDFIESVTPADRSEDGKKFIGFIKERATMGAPTLYVRVNEVEFGQGEPLRVLITSHEGRGRMWAIEQVNGPSMKVPVHVIPSGGMRARHLDEAFFEALRKTGIVAEGGGKTKDPHHINIGKIYWMGKTV